MTAVPPDPRSPEGLALVALAKAWMAARAVDEHASDADTRWTTGLAAAEFLAAVKRGRYVALARFLVETEELLEDTAELCRECEVKRGVELQKLQELNATKLALIKAEQHAKNVTAGFFKERAEQEHTIQTLREENERLRAEFESGLRHEL
jgi:hypothetical protein